MTILRTFIATFFLFAFYAQGASVPFQGESSIPEEGLPWQAEIRKSFEKIIRVKVFPHNLKNDWVHGKKDNPKTLTIVSGDVELRSNETEQIFSISGKTKIDLVNDKLLVSPENGIAFETKEFSINAQSPIQLQRENNLDKSHSYVGSLVFKVVNKEIFVANVLDIETYLKGVVPMESVYTWPLEALKAQAVAARTYAYYHLLTSSRKDYDVDDTARFQVFAGISAAKEQTNQAILETSGEVLTHKSKVIVAFFHSYSGGRTDSALNIFEKEVEYCQGAAELFTRKELSDEMEPRFRWILNWTTDLMGQKDLLAKLKKHSATKSDFKSFDSSKEFSIEVHEENELFDSVKTLKFVQDQQEAFLNFINIRKVIGWSQFPAYHFKLVFAANDNQIAFNGSGWGHHVGLSQWGAFMMAKKLGKSYDEILLHYYHDVLLGTL